MGSIEGSSQVEIPTIDFAIWNSPSSTPSQRQAVAKQLVKACHDVGFVSIINHGLSPSLLKQAFEFSRKLFDLKHEEKMLAPHPNGPFVHRGYSWPGLEKVSQVVSDDAEVGEELRAVADCKVSTSIAFIWAWLKVDGESRRAMRLVAKIIPINLISGFLSQYFLVSRSLCKNFIGIVT